MNKPDHQFIKQESKRNDDEESDCADSLSGYVTDDLEEEEVSEDEYIENGSSPIAKLAISDRISDEQSDMKSDTKSSKQLTDLELKARTYATSIEAIQVISLFCFITLN
jgi:hypothetical protein